MEKILKNKLFKEHESGLWVSEDGEVFVPKTKGHTAHFTYGSACSNGYLQVGRNSEIYKVHRLVAQCFIPNHDSLPEVNHKDEDKTNNCVTNLEWCDHKYNVNHGTRTERQAKALTGVFNTKKSKPLSQYSLDGTLIKNWPSTMEVQRVLGYAQTHIGQCCLGKLKTAYGFKWRYTG